MMNFTGQFCSWRLIWRRSAFHKQRDRECTRCVSIEQFEQVPPRGQSRRVAKSARWDGLTFDTWDENISWSSGRSFTRRRLDVVLPFLRIDSAFNRKLRFAHSELLKKGANHDNNGSG